MQCISNSSKPFREKCWLKIRIPIPIPIPILIQIQVPEWNLRAGQTSYCRISMRQLKNIACMECILLWWLPGGGGGGWGATPVYPHSPWWPSYFYGSFKCIRDIWFLGHFVTNLLDPIAFWQNLNINISQTVAKLFDIFIWILGKWCTGPV